MKFIQSKCIEEESVEKIVLVALFINGNGKHKAYDEMILLGNTYITANVCILRNKLATI